MKATPQLAALRARAQQLHESGRLAEALQVHEQALALAPEAVGIWLSAGRLAHALGLQEVALPHFERAAELDPTCYPAVDAARRLCLALGLQERAQRHTAAAYALHPVPATQAAYQLLVPAIADSAAAIEETRQRYAAALAQLSAADFQLGEPDSALGTSAFFLAYHGRNDRELQVAAARLFRKAIPSLTLTAAHCVAGATRRPGRIRVAFISRFFFSHSIYTTSHGLIEQLSRQRFEVFALRIMPSPADAATARLRAHADHTIDLDAAIDRAREQIAALQLDVLFYQDIGMDPTAYFLAFARLAPVQCVSFGHPNTTGISTMDYFVSNDLFETDEAAMHYSEKLYLTHDLPTLAYYHRPVMPVPPTPRAELGLPPGTVYLCPQTLYKVHPDFDALIAGILTADPQGSVVFIEGQFSEFTEQLRRRFAQRMPELQQRILFLKRCDFPRFLCLLAAADVVLDTVHFNGMNSSLEAFAAGTPIVTLPTALQRGRHTQAMYRKMQISDGIADSPADYIAVAVRIGTDRAYAQSLRRRILAANHVLYEDRRVVAEFERFFEHAVAHSAAV